MSSPVVSLIIPALNESKSLPELLPQVIGKVSKVIVVDNGSEDDTANVARACGALVVCVPIHGYGRACLRGIEAAQPCDVVVFMDADLSDDPENIQSLIEPIIIGKADFVLGNRMGPEGINALSLPQKYGNQFACFLMRLIWGSAYSDLGPFRAISFKALTRLGMCDLNYGWTVEMQIKAVRMRLRIREIDVLYRSRVHGVSTVSGTLSGVVRAGSKILYVIAREGLSTLLAHVSRDGNTD